MSLFSDNIKALRVGANLSQGQFADCIGISRSRYSKYEEGRSEAPYSILRSISLFFNISLDLLLGTDISKIEVGELMKLEGNRLLLPIKTDIEGSNLIEVVPHKARMGYASGYADPEFIESLQTFSLPFLRNGKFRAFPGSGNSMPPHKDSSFIVGRYVDNLKDVKDGKTYVLVTNNEGILYKRLEKSGDDSFTARSNNPIYTNYNVKFSEILEIWEFVCSIETEEFQIDDLNVETIKDMFHEIRKQLKEIKS